MVGNDRHFQKLPEKNSRNLVLHIFMGIILSAATLLVSAPHLASALSIPEKLVYDLTWTGIKAGTATQEILNDNGTVKIISTAHSADWLSTFFLVVDRIE